MGPRINGNSDEKADTEMELNRRISRSYLVKVLEMIHDYDIAKVNDAVEM